MNEFEQLKAALFDVFSAGFEAGSAQQKDLETAFEEWLEKTMLAHTPPTSPYIS